MSSLRILNGANPQTSNQSLIYFDPPMARRILASSNIRNRPLSDNYADRLMKEMISGRWQYNGEAIKFSTDDVLLDGQHRLTALSRVPDDSFSIPFLVVQGLPVESQDTMDQGKSRTARDQLNIDGLTCDRNIAGAVRVYLDWQNGHLFRDRINNRVTNTEVVAWARQHALELSLMEDISSQKLRRVKCRPSVTLAVLLHFRLIDGEAQKEFTDGLLTGAGLEAGNPILTLRERLDRIKSQGLKISDRDLIAFFVIAWNAWRQGRSMIKFQRPPGGSWDAATFPTAI